MLEEIFLKRKIKTIIKYFFEVKIYDSKCLRKPTINIEFIEYGLTVYLDVQGVCSYSDVEKHIEYIKTLFKAVSVDFSVVKGNCKLNIYLEELKDKQYKKILLTPYELLLGHNYDGIVTVDMRITPHLLITGLSGQGKTQQLKTILNNLETDFIILNGFKSDFNSDRLVIGKENIKSYLKDLTSNLKENKKPFYIAIDELLKLSADKDITKYISLLLAEGRHYNIFIIGIGQEGTKEAIKFKNLFTARVCFKMIEASSYKAVLGYNVEDTLKKQEFYLAATEFLKGKTFINSN